MPSAARACEKKHERPRAWRRWRRAPRGSQNGARPDCSRALRGQLDRRRPRVGRPQTPTPRALATTPLELTQRRRGRRAHPMRPSAAQPQRLPSRGLDRGPAFFVLTSARRGRASRDGAGDLPGLVEQRSACRASRLGARPTLRRLGSLHLLRRSSPMPMLRLGHVARGIRPCCTYCRLGWLHLWGWWASRTGRDEG
jgi:hypothetical protein